MRACVRVLGLHTIPQSEASPFSAIVSATCYLHLIKSFKTFEYRSRLSINRLWSNVWVFVCLQFGLNHNCICMTYMYLTTVNELIPSIGGAYYQTTYISIHYHTHSLMDFIRCQMMYFFPFHCTVLLCYFPFNIFCFYFYKRCTILTRKKESVHMVGGKTAVYNTHRRSSYRPSRPRPALHLKKWEK